MRAKGRRVWLDVLGTTELNAQVEREQRIKESSLDLAIQRSVVRKAVSAERAGREFDFEGEKESDSWTQNIILTAFLVWFDLILMGDHAT